MWILVLQSIGLNLKAGTEQRTIYAIKGYPLTVIAYFQAINGGE